MRLKARWLLSLTFVLVNLIGTGAASAQSPLDPVPLSNNPRFVVFRQPSQDLDVYLVDSQSRGNFFTRYSAGELATFVVSNAFATENTPAVFRVTTDAFGNTVRLSYVGNKRWLVEYSGVGVAEREIIQTDFSIVVVNVPATNMTTPTNVTTTSYVVVHGDTLFKIARRFGVTVNELVALNHIANPNRIQVGQVLLIPRR